MSTKVKMPTVQIPTLRHSVNGLVGTGMFVAPPAVQEVLTGGPNSDVEIDDLVHGVRQCQAAVKRAGEVLRRQRSVSELSEKQPRRVRSPTPIGDRKPWGASATSSSVSPRTANNRDVAPPSTVAKGQTRPQSATPRPSTPTHQELSAAAKPLLKAQSASKDIHRPKLDTATNAHVAAPVPQHHTPPTAVARRAAANISASPSPSSVKPQQRSPAPDTMLSAKMSVLEEHIKHLEEQLMLSTERVHQLEDRNVRLEQRVEQMQKDSDAAQIASRQQFLHASAQQQHMWEVIKRLESFLVAEHYGDDQHDASGHVEDHEYYRSTAVVANVQMHQAPTAMFSQERHHHTSSSMSSSSQIASRPQSGLAMIPGDVARRLDMSNESNRSVSRVPPNPPVELRQV